MQRVIVVGNSGSGKMDGLFHQPGWTSLDSAEFRAAVSGALPAGGRWVADGNYRAVRDVIWSRADTLVWLDLPRPVVTARACVGRCCGWCAAPSCGTATGNGSATCSR